MSESEPEAEPAPARGRPFCRLLLLNKGSAEGGRQTIVHEPLADLRAKVAWYEAKGWKVFRLWGTVRFR